MYCISILLVLVTVHCLLCIDLDQPPVMVVKPGETFTIACKISEYSASGGGSTNWIRHSSGKSMEWIGYFYSSSSNRVTDSLKNKISFSSESSRNAVILTGKNFNTEDTAVYYCARSMAGSYYEAFDYWGKGTSVTVTSGQPSPPKSIFGMSQCTADSDGFLTVGCLARGFSPADSLTFTWKDSKKDLSEFVQYPAFGQDGDYTKISHMRIRKSDWSPQNPYTCQASNSKGSKEVKVEFPAKPKTPPTAPPPAPPTAPTPAPPSGSVTLTLKPPVQREIFVNNKVVLEAVVSGDIKDTVSCTVNNAEGPKVKFSIDSSQSTKKYNVTVDPKKWFNGEKVTCTIRDTNNKEIKQEISFKKGDGKKPSVFIYKPDSIGTDPVSHVCEVTSPKLGDVYIMWKLDEGPYIEGTTSDPIHQKDSKSVLSILTISKKEYEKPKTITCAVKHANMADTKSPLQESTSKSEPPEPETGFALDCNEDVLEEDEFRSLWSTATSFIFLFLFSLTYSAVLSFFKVKQ